MSFNNIDNVELGELLQIFFINGLTDQLSSDIRDFDMVMGVKQEEGSGSRETRFEVLTGRGPNAIQYADPGSAGAAFPDGEDVELQEATAKAKELDITMQVPQNVYERAMKSPIYAKPILVEAEKKILSAKRRIGADLYADGTGVLSTASGAGAEVDASNNLAAAVYGVASQKGSATFCERDDKVNFWSTNGVTKHVPDVDSGTFSYFKVVKIDLSIVASPKVILAAYAADGTKLAISASQATSTIADGSLMYRVGFNKPDLSGAIADYGVISQAHVGLASLTADDARVCHGLTMDGSLAGSRTQVAVADLDGESIEEVMNLVKRSVGPSAYTWDSVKTEYGITSTFINGQDTNRRFQYVDDKYRAGAKSFAYIHRDSELLFHDSEFAPQHLMYICPSSGKNGEKPLQFRGVDFYNVKNGNGDTWNLKPSASGGFTRTMVSYMQGFGTFVNTHPAAFGVVEIDLS